VRIAITANGPGEFAGWVRPLVAALLARAPETEIHVIGVPDDYATGQEAAYIRALFPSVHAYSPREFLAFALGRPVAGMPDRVDRVQYLGGDLSHAIRVNDRLGGVATSFKFSRKKYAKRFAHVFAVDAANEAQLVSWGTDPASISVVGNLAIDGARDEAAGRYGENAGHEVDDGIIFFPGSRKHEITDALPLFVRIALNLRRLLPDVPIAFAGSPFVPDATLAESLARGGSKTTAYGAVAALEDGAIVANGQRFPLLRAAMGAASRARLAISLPGTKVIELAALGIPAIVCTPLNVPEYIVISGPFQYIGKIPLIGTWIKRTAVLAVSKRFTFLAQPNIDAGYEIEPEVRGTILPSYVASVAAERYADGAWCRATGDALRAQYAERGGAAERMVDVLLEPVSA
jgi:hypothetical protein